MKYQCLNHSTLSCYIRRSRAVFKPKPFLFFAVVFKFQTVPLFMKWLYTASLSFEH